MTDRTSRSPSRRSVKLARARWRGSVARSPPSGSTLRAEAMTSEPAWANSSRRHATRQRVGSIRSSSTTPADLHVIAWMQRCLKGIYGVSAFRSCTRAAETRRLRSPSNRQSMSTSATRSKSKLGGAKLRTSRTVTGRAAGRRTATYSSTSLTRWRVAPPKATPRAGSPLIPSKRRSSDVSSFGGSATSSARWQLRIV